MNKRIRFLIGAIVFLFVGMSGLFFGGNTYASTESISKKWVLSLYRQCMSDGLEKENLESDDQKSSVVDSIIDDAKNKSIADKLPSYNFGELSNIKTCKDVLSKAMSYNYENEKTVMWNRAAIANKLVTEVFQYEADNDRSESFQVCGDFAYGIGSYQQNSDQSCTGSISYDSETQKYSIGDGGFGALVAKIRDSQLDLRFNEVIIAGPYELNGTMQKLENDIKGDLHNISKLQGEKNINGVAWREISFSDNPIVQNKTYSLSKVNRYNVINKMNGGDKLENITKDELAELYTFYVESALPMGQKERIICGDSANKPDGFRSVNLLRNGAVQKCFVDFRAVQIGESDININDVKVRMVNNDSSFASSGYFFEADLSSVIAWLNNNLTVGATINNGANGPNDAAGDPCYGGDLKSMGWILCPAKDNMAKVDDGLMETIDQWLQIDTDYYGSVDKNGNETATHKVWGYARDLANVAMIIILLVIIFSQLTGIGINNYGIKKMLPRLITMAILINLSFIICQVLIDLSNILGDSLNKLFHSIAETIVGDPAKLNFSFQDFFGGFIAAAAGVAASAGTVMTAVSFAAGGLSGGIAIIVIVGLLVLLIAFVAIGMFFVSLALRIMIVILFTAISPLAFACYILPNTQKLFKKWWDVFKAALLVFPICGGLYGLSFIVRAIAFSGDQLEFWMAMVGTIASLLPFLLLPTLLKKSISGLGIIGDKINGIGSSLNKGLRAGLNAAKNTEAYKNRLEAGRANLNNRSANRLQEKLKNGNLSDRRRKELERRLGQRRMAIEQYGQKKGQEERFGGDDFTNEELAEAVRQNAYTDTGSKINQTLGKSDMIKEYEKTAGVGAAEISRMAAAQGMSEQLKKTVGGNKAAKQFQLENAARKVVEDANLAVGKINDEEAKRVTSAAINGTLDKVTTANGYTKNEEYMARRLMAQYGSDGLRGQLYARVKNTVDTEGRGLNAVVQAATVGKLKDITEANGYTSEQVKLAQQLASATGSNLVGKSNAEVIKAIRGNGELAVAAAKVVSPTAINDVLKNNATLNAVGLTGTQISQSIDTGTTKALNQLELEAAANATGEIRISHQRAEDLAGQRLIATRKKEFSEDFSMRPRGDIVKVLEAEMSKASGGDSTMISAALADIYSKGGIEDIMSSVYNTEIRDANIQKAVDDFMATMTDPVAKQYGKYRAAEGTGTFAEFVAGTAAKRPDGGISSFKEYLETLDENGFNNAVKDTIKFLNSTGEYDIVSDAQAANLAFAAKGEDRAAALQMVRGKIENSENARVQIAQTYSDAQWSNMSLDLIQTITGATDGQTVSDVANGQLKGLLSTVRNNIKNNPRLLEHLKPEVRKFFGI